tara:strand:- start:96 stop:440 length:345 start_codon:yes stop_codon:yes gene_type:complete
VRVRADWKFGKGKADYLTGSEAIAQNVRTRLKSFTDDWFLDMSDGVPWVTLLSETGTERRILRAIERTVLQTEGVVSMSDLEIVAKDQNRKARIAFTYTDVFSRTYSDQLEVAA